MVSNLDSIAVDSSGRVSFSGLGTGIDFQGAVEQIVAAKRIPVDRLEASITANGDKIASFQEFRSHLNGLRDTLGKLYGAVSADRSQDIFEAKEAFAASSRTDTQSASRPADILGVTVTSLADVGSHTIEVVRLAASQRVGSDRLTSQTADLGTATGAAANSLSGSFSIAGVQIDVLATDSLKDLVDRINNANKGASPTGVAASIVRASSTENYLVLTVSQPGKSLGTDIALTDTDGILADLGVLDGGGDFQNVLQAARKAQFYADGLLDPAKYVSAAQAGTTTALGLSGTIDFRDAGGVLIDSVTYAAGDTLEDIEAAIAGNANLATAGIGASIASGSGGFTLTISGSDAFGLTDSGAALSTLGVAKDRLLLERESNTVSDLFKGMTFNLFKAEPGTTVRIDIERNLGQVKSALTGFVDAYNQVRQFLNTQLDTDPATGKSRDGSVLYGARTLKDIENQLNRILGDGARGVDSAFSVLAQIGVGYVNNNTLADPTLQNTLSVDDSKLDAALLNNLDDVRKLFQFDFSSPDPRFTLLAFTGATSHSASGYQIDVEYDEIEGRLLSATVDGVPATVSGQQITMTEGPAKGLKLFYGGNTDVAGVQLDFTVGIGANMFFALQNMLDSKTGSVETAIKELDTSNNQSQTRIDDMMVRIDLQRESLLQRFTRMEALLASLERTKESIKQMTDAMFASRD